ncbi:MAG: hypothetical protein HXY34_11710 [Candidatus Thorarchaeota archaeon]|nr:hypothetical protein [Candidatus Thorarchaeota archaeon]
MPSSDCDTLDSMADDMAKLGCNTEAVELFIQAAECWRRWEQYAKAATSYERAYEHGMLCHSYGPAGEAMMEAAYFWILEGQHQKYEIDCQIASEAFILAAEHEKNPKRFVDGAFSSIMGGDLELARQLIHAAAETTHGQAKELINLALMLSEYQFGDAEKYIDAALVRVMTREGVSRVKRQFVLLFADFVRTSLESEVAVSIASLSESTGLEPHRVEGLVKRGIDEGIIPAYLDEESKELVVDSDRMDVSDLARRRRPILSRDIEDPGAWDTDIDE